MRADEPAQAERLLARLVARAYAADHPDLFGKAQDAVTADSGLPSAAAEDGVAPAPSEGGPEESWSVEHENREDTT